MQTRWFDSERCSYIVDTSGADYLLACLPEILPKLDPHISDISATFGNPSKELTALLKERNRSKAWTLYSCISITATVSVDVETLVTDNPGQEFDTGTLMSIAAECLAQAIEKTLMISAIAYPGEMDALVGTTVVEEKTAQPIREKETFRSLSRPEMEDPRWPLVSRLELSLVIEWLSRTGFSGELPEEALSAPKAAQAKDGFAQAGGEWGNDAVAVDEVLLGDLEGRAAAGESFFLGRHRGFLAKQGHGQHSCS
jgi:hypothetical protein